MNWNATSSMYKCNIQAGRTVWFNRTVTFVHEGGQGPTRSHIDFMMHRPWMINLAAFYFSKIALFTASDPRVWSYHYLCSGSNNNILADVMATIKHHCHFTNALKPAVTSYKIQCAAGRIIVTACSLLSNHVTPLYYYASLHQSLVNLRNFRRRTHGWAQ